LYTYKQGIDICHELGFTQQNIKSLQKELIALISYIKRKAFSEAQVNNALESIGVQADIRVVWYKAYNSTVYANA
jgi:hypothetical protein